MKSTEAVLQVVEVRFLVVLVERQISTVGDIIVESELNTTCFKRKEIALPLIRWVAFRLQSRPQPHFHRLELLQRDRPLSPIQELKARASSARSDLCS